MADKIINSDSFEKLDPRAWALVRVVRDLDKATGKEKIRTEWEKRSPDPKNCRLTSILGVRRFLGRIINMNYKGQISDSKLRSLSYACESMIKAFYGEDLADQVAKMKTELIDKGLLKE